MAIADVRTWMARARQGLPLARCDCGGSIVAPEVVPGQPDRGRDVFTRGADGVTHYLGQCQRCHNLYTWPDGRDGDDAHEMRTGSPRPPRPSVGPPPERYEAAEPHQQQVAL